MSGGFKFSAELVTELSTEQEPKRYEVGDRIEGMISTGDPPSLRDAFGIVGQMLQGLYSYESPDPGLFATNLSHNYPHFRVDVEILPDAEPGGAE